MMYDAHIHNLNLEDGGFLIGLEGTPYFEGTWKNEEVLTHHNPEHNYFAFYYVTKEECDKRLEHGYLKYHPRREQYSKEEVITSIRLNQPRAVIIDTLNEPFWTAYDYWDVARACADVPMVFAHAGGYLINEFIKICHFQKNVWVDFALTHTTLGKYGSSDGLPYIHEAIHYALHSAFKDKVLLSSDYPFFDQKDVFDYYEKDRELLNNNFIRLCNLIR